MANAASQQAIEVGKDRLREFLESSETARHTVPMGSSGDGDGISLSTLDSRGKRRVTTLDEGHEDDEI